MKNLKFKLLRLPFNRQEACVFRLSIHLSVAEMQDVRPELPEIPDGSHDSSSGFFEATDLDGNEMLQLTREVTHQVSAGQIKVKVH